MFEPAGTFGVPQLLNLAQYLKRHANALVRIIDLDHERGPNRIDLVKLSGEFDVVGLSCYSSFDYLKIMAIAAAIRQRHPRLTLVTGGYHPSARPQDFTTPDSPFDYVIVGDGEIPLARLVNDVASGRRPLNRVLGPDALSSPREVMPYDWSLLERYRPGARRRASQAEIYLSRGCPYDCSFCMERAKRETSWRSLEPAEAVEELHRLDSWLDLRGWTLRVVDPLFGMKRSWRRAFLEELARRPVRARKLWLLIRLDLVEREDFALMARCNVAPGFGLESGDPEQLRRIRKAGMLSGYLDRMLDVAQWAREFHVPFGANIIAGHPGETEASLRNSAAFMRKLFLDNRGTMGFLSVDPFRLYPGSPIADELATWQASTGMQAHRYPWWEDGDQDFLAEWIDPSAELSYERREALTFELFAPIVEGVATNFRYQGPAADYFRRAVNSQIRLFGPRRRTRTLTLHAMWQRLLGQSDAASSPTSLSTLATLNRDARSNALQGLELSPSSQEALRHVPRERFVPTEEVPSSGNDRACRLTRDAWLAGIRQAAQVLQTVETETPSRLLVSGAGASYLAALFASALSETSEVVCQETLSTLTRVAEQLISETEVPHFVLSADLELHESRRRSGWDCVVLTNGQQIGNATGARVVRVDFGALGELRLFTDGRQMDVAEPRPKPTSTPQLLEIDSAGQWFDLVFHVLAYVDPGRMPASVFCPEYTGWVERRAKAGGRAIHEHAEQLADMGWDHQRFAQLQTLAWMFDGIQQAQDSGVEFLTALEQTDVHSPSALRNVADVPGAQRLFEACLDEAPHFLALSHPRLDRPALQAELQRLNEIAPWMAGFRFHVSRSLGHFGRVWQNGIWVGTPNRALDVSATHVAWQAAHEATVAWLRSRHRAQNERQIEALALEKLSDSARHAGRTDEYQLWLARWMPARAA